ncbi:BRCA1-associated RING domain protein 1 isoform X2 [Microcaecilia unicolor]|uniref:BRCA1-associated RING domain protein 1 isoform X2 n=1 Tax=Microcaecilia unicolor TaxID=1415580 RepID=A0A6P7YMR9_9AMPH|nr:BRCA1-associated RING domain protein 1 isoform X2 [Microcaecilia unicolor]
MGVWWRRNKRSLLAPRFSEICQERTDNVHLKDSPVKEAEHKKKQIRMWFSPRSKRVRYILDKEQKQQQQPPVVFGGTSVQASCNMYDFLPSPPNEKPPKKEKKSRCKNVIKKSLTDINLAWGFGKEEQKEGSEIGVQISEDDLMQSHVEKVVSFCSQPLVLCGPELNTVGKTVLDAGPDLESSLIQNEKLCYLSIGTKTLQNREPTYTSETFGSSSFVSEKPLSSEMSITPVKCKRRQLRCLNATFPACKRQKRSKLHASGHFCVHEDCLGFSSEKKSESITQSLSSVTAGPVISSLPQRNTIKAVKNMDSPTVTKFSKSSSTLLPNTADGAKIGHWSPLVMQISPSRLSNTKRNHKGETPLHVASIKGDVPIVEQLLLSGADPNVKDHAGWTPLHEACNLGHERVVILLLQHMALVNTAGYQNETPLHDAVKNGHINIVKLLLRHGASQDAVNIFGLQPIDYAENEEMKSLLQQPPSLKNEGHTVVHPSYIINAGLRREGPIVLMGSGLTSDQQRDQSKLSVVLKAGICTEFNSSVTHLIVPDEPILNTMKCMLGILAGCWILKFNWVKICLATRDREQEEGYEIPDGPQRGRLNREHLMPRLFDGCYFFFMGNFVSHKKDDLADLVKAAGGQILTRQPKPDSDVTQTVNTVAYHAKPGSDQSFCTQYIIYEKTSKYHPDRIRQGKVWVAPTSWLINCITSFQLLPVEE